MVVSKIYETKDGCIAAVVFENGLCINYIADPEVVAIDSEGLLEEAKLGFPEAFNYERDISAGNSLEDMKRIQEEESKLIAEVGQNIIVYPQRMGSYTQEIFKIELGEECWNEILQQVNGDNGIQLNI